MSFIGVSIVINPNFFWNIIANLFGYSQNENPENQELSSEYIIGILFCLVVPFLGPIIGLVWKLYPKINHFLNLFYWSLLMIIGSSLCMIFLDIESEFYLYFSNK